MRRTDKSGRFTMRGSTEGSGGGGLSKCRKQIDDDLCGGPEHISLLFRNVKD